MSKKNILFLMTDEHRFDVAGFAGNNIVKTPNLDRIAKMSYQFTNAYTASPICVPGRMALMAGQLPTNCNCRGWQDLEPNYYTFARHFAVNGYKTVACGKLHHMGSDQMQGFTRRIGNEVGIARNESNGLKPFGRLEDTKWSDAKEIKRACIGESHNYIDDEYTKLGALNYINVNFCDPSHDRCNPDVPLLLKISFNQPHYPYVAPDERKFNYYLNRVKPYENQMLSNHPFLQMRKVTVGEDVSKREEIRAIAAYYAMVETIDECIGEILDRLENVGQKIEDWVIVYTSDHGEMLGEHGVWEKQKFYEGSARVPLLIHIPGKDGGIIDKNVSLCDLYATLSEACGLDIPQGLDSRSLLPLMDGDEDWDNEVVSQFFRSKELVNVMIKKNYLKYQYYPDMEEVLFDLADDKDEMVNLIDDNRYSEAIAGFREKLVKYIT